MIMEELRKLLNEQLNKDFGSAVLSGAHDKTGGDESARPSTYKTGRTALSAGVFP